MTKKEVRCMDILSLIRQQIRRFYEQTISSSKYANFEARAEDIDILSYHDAFAFATYLSRIVQMMDQDEFCAFWDSIGGHIYEYEDLPAVFDESDDDHTEFYVPRI
jgi:hypothetical protein